MRQSVNFLMSGTPHLPYLVVALSTLRNHYFGDVVVHAYPESFPTVSCIVEDERIRAEAKLYSPTYTGKNSQFINKIIMMQQIEADVGLYIDADTIINGSLDPLFNLAEMHGFVATQFCDWVSNKGVIRNRVRGMLGRDGIDQVAVQKVLLEPFPSVNGGVFGCLPFSQVLEKWYVWTMLVKNLFIADETVLHAIMGLYSTCSDQFAGSNKLEGLKEFVVACGGKWNCSPKYQPKSLKDEDVIIWHGHGDSFVRPKKSHKGFDLWWPLCQKCLRDNVGGMRNWIRNVNNRFLRESTNEDTIKC